jgi:hypothetical protein
MNTITLVEAVRTSQHDHVQVQQSLLSPNQSPEVSGPSSNHRRKFAWYKAWPKSRISRRRQCSIRSKPPPPLIATDLLHRPLFSHTAIRTSLPPLISCCHVSLLTRPRRRHSLPPRHGAQFHPHLTQHSPPP